MSTVIEGSLSPEEVVRQLRALRAQIPDFALLSREEARSLDRAAAVDVALVHEAVNAIAASPPLKNALERDAEVLRAEAGLTGRWSEVIVELDAFRLGVAGAIKRRSHRLGGTALKAYQMSIQLVRYRENAALLPHIEAMLRVLKTSRRRPVSPAPEPATKPAA